MSYDIIKKLKEIDKNMERMISIKYILIPLTIILGWFLILRSWTMVIVFIIMIYCLVKLKNKYKKYLIEE